MKKKKRLIQGKDYHGWVWKAKGWPNGEDGYVFFHWAEPDRPKRRMGTPTEDGKWVRVKFVEVKHPNGSPESAR